MELCKPSWLSPPPGAPLVVSVASVTCAHVLSTHHQYWASQPEPGDTDMPMAAVQDVTHLPSASKGCLEEETEAFLTASTSTP